MRFIGAQRSFLGPDGYEWCVREIVSTPDTQPSLVFDTDLFMRRVRNYPADWRELSVDELAGLYLTRGYWCGHGAIRSAR